MMKILKDQPPAPDPVAFVAMCVIGMLIAATFGALGGFLAVMALGGR